MSNPTSTPNNAYRYPRDFLEAGGKGNFPTRATGDPRTGEHVGFSR